MLRSLIVAALVFATGNSFADAMADTIEAGAFDCITTGEALAGVTRGQLRELNPAGAIAACALKVPAILLANQLDEPDRTEALHAQRAAWDAAGAHNIALLVGASAPLALGASLVVALVVWERGADEREFMQACAIHRALAGRELTCKFSQEQRK